MHLRLTDEELWDLAEMLHLAFWIASYSRKPEAEPGVRRYDALLQKVLEKVKNAGFTDVITYDPERQGLAFREDFQDKAFFTQRYDEFRLESFWEELVMRMADRDLIEEIGLPAFEKLGPDERKARTEASEKRYWAEFEKRGIDRLNLLYSEDEG